VVIGADGKHSIVAKTVRAEHYNDVAQLQTGYYAYWSGLPVSGLRTTSGPNTGAGLPPYRPTTA
jgi:hypothetical protein